MSFFNTYLKPYLKIAAIIDKSKAKILLADGSTVWLSKGNCLDIVLDTNGDKMPNTDGKDRFSFLLCTKDYNESILGKNKYFGTYYQVTPKTRNKALESCKNNTMYCSALLQFDNWKFKSNYPY